MFFVLIYRFYTISPAENLRDVDEEERSGGRAKAGGHSESANIDFL